MGFMFSRPVGSSESKRIQSVIEQISITDTTSPIYRMLQQLQDELARSSSPDFESELLAAYSLRDLASQSMFTFKKQNKLDMYAVRPIGENQRNEWKKHNYLRGLNQEEIQRIYRVYNLLILILGLTALMTLEYTSSSDYKQLIGNINQNNHHLYKLFKYIRTSKGDPSSASASGGGTGAGASSGQSKGQTGIVNIPYLQFINRFSSLYNELKSVTKKDTVETVLSVPKDFLIELHTKPDNFQGYYTFKVQSKGSNIRGEKNYVSIPTSDTQWLPFLETLFSLDTLGFCSPDKRYQSMVQSFSTGNTTDLAMFITDFIANLFGRNTPEFQSMYDILKKTFASYLRVKEMIDETSTGTETKSLRGILQKPYTVLLGRLQDRCSNPVNGIINARIREGSAIESPFKSSSESSSSSSSSSSTEETKPQKKKIKMSSKHASLIKEYNSMIMKLRASIIRGFNQVFVVDKSPDTYKVVFSFEDKESSQSKSKTETGTESGKPPEKPPKKFLALKNQISLSNNPEKILLNVLTKMLIDMFATHARMIERTHSILVSDLPKISKEYLKKPENVILLQSSAQKQSGYIYSE
jgi:hypothetical protein